MSLKTGIRPSVKNDPRLVAVARELKDRWLAQVNGGMCLAMANGKYEVSRWIWANGTGGGARLMAGELPAIAACGEGAAG
jgi:hypothetical protein